MPYEVGESPQHHESGDETDSSVGPRPAPSDRKFSSWSISSSFALRFFRDGPPSQRLQDLEDAEVVTKVKELEQKVKRLKTENTIYQRFLEKNDEYVEEIPTTPLRRVSQSSRRSSVASSLIKSAAVPSGSEDKETKISINQKMELVQKEMDDIQTNMNTKKKRLEKIKYNLVARFEEMGVRKAELEKSIENFQQLRQSYDPLPPDKFTRFMDEWSKKTRLMADKIRLRYSSLKVQHHKLSAILAHKQMIGENLQEIDFEQLRIENVHLAEKIEQKVLLLSELKKMTGAGNLQLSQHQGLLQKKMDEKEALVQAIKSVEKDIIKSDDEIMKLYTEVDDVKTEYEKVKDRLRKFEAPDVMDYIMKKMEVNNLRKELKIWSRRKAIKNSALDIEIKEMKKLLRCKTVHPCWFE